MDHIKNDASSNSTIVARIHCRGIVFTEPLPSNIMRDTIYKAVSKQQMNDIHTSTQTDGRDL
jgi:hypothetical protein